MRNSEQSKEKLTNAKMKREMKQTSQSTLYNFSRSANLQVPGIVDERSGPNTLSSVNDDEGWRVDHDDVNCEVTDARWLDCYPLEQLVFALKARSRLVLLIVDFK